MEANTSPPNSNPLRLGWRGMLFGEDALSEVRASANPLGLGFRLAVVFAAIAGLSGALGIAFDSLVSPSPAEVQAVVLEDVRGMSWYRQEAAGPNGAEFEAQFEQGYELWWRLFPSLFGLPSVGGAAAQLILSPIVTVAGWALISLLVLVFARLLGGRASLSETLGVLGLAAAPNLLQVLSIWPGVDVGWLVRGWAFALGYWAVLRTHELSWGRALLALSLPRILVFTILLVVGGGFALLLALAAGRAG